MTDLGDWTVALLVLLGAPIALGAFLWLVILFEGGGDDSDRTRLDLPPWW